MSASRRRWLYDIGTAVTACLGVYGILSGDKADAINVVLAAVLNLARRNVPSDDGEPL